MSEQRPQWRVMTDWAGFEHAETREVLPMDLVAREQAPGEDGYAQACERLAPGGKRK